MPRQVSEGEAASGAQKDGVRNDLRQRQRPYGRRGGRHHGPSWHLLGISLAAK